MSTINFHTIKRMTFLSRPSAGLAEFAFLSSDDLNYFFNNRIQFIDFKLTNFI